MRVIAFPESLGLISCTALIQPFEFGGYTARSLDLESHGPAGKWQSRVHGRGAMVDIARGEFLRNLERQVQLALRLQRGFPQGALILDGEEVAREFTSGTNSYISADIFMDELVKQRSVIGDKKRFYEVEVQFFRTNVPYRRQYLWHNCNPIGH
ncbi:MAG TPA: hypothetical protein VJK52_01730 [Candidatus Nanoarchaeia archaeon]|nr:hypothetical protein [Candidatus Nanoarchaeia archaeon]